MSTYWRTRLEAIGHTGWSDPLFYAYDQLERIAIVRALVERRFDRPVRVLDFGCGVGDFSRMLLSLGHSVTAYDPFVEPKITHPRFEYVGDHSSIERDGDAFDLILSVTVLDHVLDDVDAVAELAMFRRVCARNGCAILIEYALDQPGGRESSYQAFRTFERWTEMCGKAGLRISAMTPMPQPLEAPSRGFLEYYRSRPLKLIRSPRLRFVPQRVKNRIAAMYAARVFRRVGPGEVASSPLKLLLCESGGACTEPAAT